MDKHARAKKTTSKRIAVFLSIMCMISTMMACIEQKDNGQELSSGIASVTEETTSFPSQKGKEADDAMLSPTGKPDKTSTPSPMEKPTETPTPSPTEKPTEAPTPTPTEKPTKAPIPTEESAATPTKKPTSGSSDKETSGSGNSNFNTHDNPDQQETEDTWVLNTNSKKIHYPSCSSVKKIAPKNYSTSSKSLDTLKPKGYTTCGICFK